MQEGERGRERVHGNANGDEIDKNTKNNNNNYDNNNKQNARAVTVETLRNGSDTC